MAVDSGRVFRHLRIPSLSSMSCGKKEIGPGCTGGLVASFPRGHGTGLGSTHGPHVENSGSSFYRPCRLYKYRQHSVDDWKRGRIFGRHRKGKVKKQGLQLPMANGKAFCFGSWTRAKVLGNPRFASQKENSLACVVTEPRTRPNTATLIPLPPLFASE